MKFINTILLIVCCALGVNAQQMHITYTRMIGGNDGATSNDALFDTTDKSIVFTGFSGDSCGTGDLPPCPPVTGRRDLLVGKLDSNRNLVWIRQYGGSSDDAGAFIQKATNNNGYFLLGGTGSLDGDVVGNHGVSDICFLKLNNQGNIQWSKCYGCSNGGTGPGKCMETQDGGYIIIGSSSGSGDDVPFQYVNSQFATDWIILKIDSLGNKQWAKTIGGTGGEYFCAIYQIGDYYYVAGYSASHDHECSDESWHPGHNNTGGDYFLIKLDSAGNYLWNKSYGGTGDDQMEDAIYDERDSSFVMAGHTTSRDYMVPYFPSPRQDVLVIKVDLSGNLKWSKVFGDNSNEWHSKINKSIINKGYLVTCEADLNNPIPSYYYGGGIDDRLFLIDSSGALIADKVVGGTSQEYWCTAIQLDKGIAVVGNSFSYPFGEGITTPIRGGGLSPNIYVSYLDFWSASVPTITDEQSNLKVYPNPAENKITIELNHNAKGSLRITDMIGKLVWQQTIKEGTNKWNINTQGWQRGSYIINYINEQGQVKNNKIILQ